jgi:hypothetical protein
MLIIGFVSLSGEQMCQRRIVAVKKMSFKTLRKHMGEFSRKENCNRIFQIIIISGYDAYFHRTGVQLS